MEMDLQNKTSKKNLFIGAGIFVILIITALLVIFVIFPTTKDQVTQNTRQGISFLTNKIDSGFYDTFNKKEPEPEPEPEPVDEKPKTVDKKTPEPKKQDMKFNNLFNAYKREQNKPNEIQQFLNKANRSSQVRTYAQFEKSKETAEEQEIISTGYEQLGIDVTDASFPVDFTRTLTVDRRIDAILIEDIDSTLGGKVTAQIENNVYAAQGRNVLIPVGSKAIGYYEPLTKIGEERLKIIWSRIITPKGINIVMNSEMTDSMGRSGIAGEVDTKFWDKYGLALLISTVSALAQASQSVTTDQAIFVNTYGEDLSNLSATILEEQININPIIKIPAGSRILISPTQDIWFKNAKGVIEIKSLSM